MKRILTILLAATLLLALPACKTASPDQESVQTLAGTAAGDGMGGADAPAGPASPVDGRVVAFISGDPADPFFAVAKEGAQKYAARWGLDLRCPSELGQTAAVQQAIDEGVDGICIAAANTDALEEKLREARKAGIAVTTWYSDVSPDARTLTVSQGTAAMLGPLLVEMGATSLRERGIDTSEPVGYVWHASDLASPEQSAWYAAGREYLASAYPEWVMLADPVSSEGDEALAVEAGGALLDEYPDVQLVICSDRAALAGQCRAVQERGMTAETITVTGFCPLSVMQPYLDAGICTRWGLWDCGMQAAMGCYLAAWLSEENAVHVGEVINIPRIGSVEVLANSVLVPEQKTGEANSGVVLLPERIVFTAENAADYSF